MGLYIANVYMSYNGSEKPKVIYINEGKVKG